MAGGLVAQQPNRTNFTKQRPRS